MKTKQKWFLKNHGVFNVFITLASPWLFFKFYIWIDQYNLDKCSANLQCIVTVGTHDGTGPCD